MCVVNVMYVARVMHVMYPMPDMCVMHVVQACRYACMHAWMHACNACNVCMYVCM